MQYYHGKRRKRNYFEGWYIKHQTEATTVAFIPAYHMDRLGRKSASLQVVTNTGTWHLDFPFEVFAAKEHTFFVRMGNNRFSLDGCHIDIAQDGLCIQGDIWYQNPCPLGSDIMGPFRFIPHMQCSHGVLSMGHTLAGSLSVNGEILSFDGGTGYIETDRGSSFPQTYLWTQCNVFKKDDCSIMASVANIPLGPFSFLGCICSIIYKGTEYRLATYDGAHVVSFDADGLTLIQGKKQLHISLLEEKPFALRAPCAGEMTSTIHESPACSVRYQFLLDGQLLFDRSSPNASFEFVSPSNHR